MKNASKDFFRPRRNPAQMIYDALVEEAKHRSGRTSEEWQDKELGAVCLSAEKYAIQQGITAPSVEDIVAAEVRAQGHVDYMAKWAINVGNMMSV